MKLSKENNQRAKDALAAVLVFSELPGNEAITGRPMLEQNITDLLANLGQLCDREALNLKSLISAAQRHYEAESDSGPQFAFLDRELPTQHCGHNVGEDCMICTGCGECRETCDEENELCDGCRSKCLLGGVHA